MKQKKQIKGIISLLVMIAVLLGGWWMVRPNVLQAKKERTSGRTVYNVPRPQNENQINVGKYFSFVEDAGQVDEDINNQVNPPESYLWTNVVQMLEQDSDGNGVPGQKGALWYLDKVSLEKDFEGSFECYFGKFNGDGSYDGISITLQNDSLDAIGSMADGFGVSSYGKNDDYVKNAVAVIIDAGEDAVFTVIPQGAQNNVRQLPQYNYTAKDAHSLADGQWRTVVYRWHANEQLFEYGVGNDTEQWINFKTGETSGAYKNGGEIVNPTPHIIPEIKAAADKVIAGTASYPTAAEEYFQGTAIWWGFTGTSHGKMASRAIAPLVAVGQTPNQSQSPLQLSMKKLGEIDTETGKRAPLEGAEFILQTQDAADRRWRQFNPGNVIKDPNDLIFTTGADGKIVIKATDNQKHADLIDLVLQYGGTYNGEPATETKPSNYAAFRFREVKAAPNPDGDAYLDPPAIDPDDPKNYAASEPENSAALFSTKSVKLSGASTTPTDPTEENPDDGDFGTVYNSNQPWLPYYQPNPALEGTIGSGGWLNAATSYIPKVNALGFKYYSGENNTMKTKIIGWSSGIGIHEQPDGSLTYDYGFGWEMNGPLDIPYNNYVQMNLNSTVANPTGQQWIAFTNVGFYNGQPIGGLMKITPKAGLNLPTASYKQKSSVGIGLANPVSGTYTAKVDSLFSVIMGPKVPYVDVAYEFFDTKDLTKLTAEDGAFPEIPEANKLELAPYLSFDRLKVDKTMSFNKEMIKNIYSVPRDYTPLREAMTLTYSETADQLKVTKVSSVYSTGPLSHLLTLTPKNNQEMQYQLSVQEGTVPFDDGNGAYYSVETPVKVEFPDPQPTTTTYEEIIEEGKGIKGIIDSASQQKIDDFSYQFVQSIPWETGTSFYAEDVPINNRTQFPEWQLETNDVESAPIGGLGVWQVQSLDNPALPTDTWFTVSEDNQQITPKDTVVTAGNSDFYNHFYSFGKNVQIDYDHKVTKNDLALTTVGDQQYYYYSVNGKVKLKVTDTNQTSEQKGMNLGRPTVEYETKINFYAPIKYRYVYKDAAGNLQEISGLDATSYPTQGEGIVTWDAPLTPMTFADYEENGEIPAEKTQAPTIAGYTFKSAAFNDEPLSPGNLAQVKVTKLLKDGGDATKAEDYTKPNEVVLFYEPQGDVEIEDKDDEGVTTYLADDIDFGNITVPTASTITKAPEANNGTDKDQYPSLVVKDTRLKNYREAGWTLYVTMTEPFRLKKGDGTFDDDQTIENILKYKNNFTFNQDGEEIAPTELAITKGDKIPIESLIPTATQLNETIWRTQVDLGAQKEENGEASKGFYLEINKPTQLGIKAGEYQAELTFSVENSAFTTPTP